MTLTVAPSYRRYIPVAIGRCAKFPASKSLTYGTAELDFYLMKTVLKTNATTPAAIGDFPVDADPSPLSLLHLTRTFILNQALHPPPQATNITEEL